MINRRDFCKNILGAGAVLGYPLAISEANPTREEDVGEILRSIADVIANTDDVFSHQSEFLLEFLTQPGQLYAGIGFGTGADAIIQACRNACNCRLLKKRFLKEASTILVIVTGGPDLSLQEVNDAVEPIRAQIDVTKGVSLQIVFKDDMTDKRRVTIIACVA